MINAQAITMNASKHTSARSSERASPVRTRFAHTTSSTEDDNDILIKLFEVEWTHV